MHTIRLYQQGPLLDLFIDLSPVEAELKYQELSSQPVPDSVLNEPLNIHEFQVDASGHIRLILDDDSMSSVEEYSPEQQQKLSEIKSILGQALKVYSKAS